MENSTPAPPPLPEVISNRKLRTYKILLITAILGLLGSLFFISLLVKNQKKQPIAQISPTPTNADLSPTSDMQFPTLTPAPREDNSPYRLVSSTCNGEECLFINGGLLEVEGYAKLKGYYHAYETTDWGDKKTTCESLVITGGSKTLIDSFQKQIAAGNGINKLDEQNSLLVNIDTRNLSAAEKSLITTSTKNKQVELHVIRITPEGRGAPTCFSFVEIITAKMAI